MPRDYLRAGVLVAVVVSAAVFAGTTAAASEPSIEATDDSPGAVTEHTATMVVDGSVAGSSWNGFQIDYEATDVSNVGQGDIQTIGIDRGNDESGTTVDESVMNDLSSAGGDNNGQSLDIGLDGSSDINSGDQLVVVFADAQNPGSSGQYDVTLHVNSQSTGESAQTTLSIGSTATTTATPTTTSTPTSTPTTQDNDDGITFGSDPDVSLVQGSQPYVNASPNTANETATHAAMAVVDVEMGNSSWTGLEVNYSGTGTDVSNVDQGDVVKIGIDRGDDDPNTTIDRSLTPSLGEVSGSNDGETLTFGLDGNYELGEGDQVVAVYEDVQNPAAGDYSVGIEINPQSSDEEVSATLSIEAASTTTATATAEPTETATAEPTPTQTDAPTTTAESTPSTSPGFGAVAAAVALVAAAALLVRR